MLPAAVHTWHPVHDSLVQISRLFGAFQMKDKLSIVLLILLSVYSCRTDTETNTQAVKATILRYNQLLAEGYANMNMNPLQEVATADQAGKEYRHMAALGEAKIRMEAALKSIEFAGIVVSRDGTASAVTKEVWDYTHLHVRTRTPGAKQKNVVYALKYELKKENTRWRVASIETIDQKESSSRQAN